MKNWNKLSTNKRQTKDLSITAEIDLTRGEYGGPDFGVPEACGNIVKRSVWKSIIFLRDLFEHCNSN